MSLNVSAGPNFCKGAELSLLTTDLADLHFRALENKKMRGSYTVLELGAVTGKICPSAGKFYHGYSSTAGNLRDFA